MSDTNRRIVKINDIKRINNKVSTEDKATPPNNYSNEDKEDKIMYGQIRLNIQPSSKKEMSEQALQKLEENTKKMEKEYNDMKDQLKSEESKTLEQVGSLNKQLEQLNQNQLNILKYNKTLLNKLRKMYTEVSKKYGDKFKMSKILENQKALAYKKDINMKIKFNENVKITIQKDIEYNKDEIDRLSQMIQELTEVGGEEGLLAEVVRELQKDISKIQKEINNLNLIKYAHESCIKNENILKSQINVLNSDIEFELKKNLMISHIQPKKQKKIITGNIERLDYGLKLRNNLLRNTKNRYNAENDFYVNTRSYNIIKKELYTDEKVIKKKNKSSNKINTEGFNAENIANNKLIVKPQLYLFTEAEKEILQNIVPNKYLNNLNEKYNQKKKEMKEIEESYKPQTELKRQLYKDNLRYEEINLKQNELNLKKGNLLAQHIQNNKKIREVKNKIKTIKEKINREAKKLSGKVVKNKLIQNIINKYIETRKKENEKTIEKTIEKELKNE